MTNLADIVGSGAVVQIASPNITARWVQLILSGTAGLTARIGGSNVTSTLGLPVAAGGGLFLPVQAPDGLSTSPYSLAALYAYIPVGATLSVAYEPFN
jgi:hypothetical protein